MQMQQYQKEIIEFTKQLVSTPSQNGIDSEKDVAKLVFQELTDFGFEPQIIGPKDHPSVICEIKKSNSSKTIWLESCLDTVPAGDISKWDYPPFEGKIVENSIGLKKYMCYIKSPIRSALRKALKYL